MRRTVSDRSYAPHFGVMPQLNMWLSKRGTYLLRVVRRGPVITTTPSQGGSRGT